MEKDQKKLTKAMLLMSSQLLPFSLIKSHFNRESTKRYADYIHLEKVKTSQLEGLLVKAWIFLFFHLRQIYVKEISRIVGVSGGLVLQDTVPGLVGH